MATTTNYSWTTPDDTALVKDGAAAIRSLGTAIDTTTKNLNPSTTLGDIQYRSSTANTNTRLGIGTSGQVLTVSGGVPSWATASSGGMTLLSTTTLSGASTTVSSVDQTYRDLVIYVYGAQWNTAPSDVYMSCNISTVFGTKRFGNTSFTSEESANSRVRTDGQVVRNTGSNFFVWEIKNYASTTAFKTFDFTGIHLNTDNKAEFTVGGIRSTTAVSSITFGIGDGYTMTAGTIQIYGVK
jgi:hypothetical protein